MKKSKRSSAGQIITSEKSFVEKGPPREYDPMGMRSEVRTLPGLGVMQNHLPPQPSVEQLKAMCEYAKTHYLYSQPEIRRPNTEPDEVFSLEQLYRGDPKKKNSEDPDSSPLGVLVFLSKAVICMSALVTGYIFVSNYNNTQPSVTYEATPTLQKYDTSGPSGGILTPSATPLAIETEKPQADYPNLTSMLNLNPNCVLGTHKYVVNKGDTLGGILTDHLNDLGINPGDPNINLNYIVNTLVYQVSEKNYISDPNSIFPGDTLILPACE